MDAINLCTYLNYWHFGRYIDICIIIDVINIYSLDGHDNDFFFFLKFILKDKSLKKKREEKPLSSWNIEEKQNNDHYN